MKYLPLEKPGAGHTGYQQQVKEANIKRIFDLVRSGKCKSRAEIVRHMNLSATSVSVLVEELANRKLIDETGPTQTTLPGRRPISLRLNKNAHHMAVFSAHPEGLRFAVLNLECRIIEESFFPLDCRTLDENTAPDAYLELADDILRNRSRRFNPSRAVMIGICFPGVYNACDHIYDSTQVLGYSIAEQSLLRFQERVNLPFYLMNGTRSMAYAEKTFLDAASPNAPEIQDLLFVNIQEGIRCAIISGGEIFTGPYNVSGEIGHFTIDYQGRPCRCGNRGCLERYVNLNAILEDAWQAAQEAGIAPPQTFEELARRYPDEPALLVSVKQSARLLSFGLYDLMCCSGMRRIVLGGGIEVLGDIFLREVYHALMGRSMLIRSLDLSYAQAGPDAVILGVTHHYLDKAFTITV